jgi:hypothetical protein
MAGIEMMALYACDVCVENEKDEWRELSGVCFAF